MINLNNIHFKYVFLLFLIIFLNNIVLANNIKNSAVVFMYHKFDKPEHPSTNITLKQFVHGAEFL